jgi:tight adherence protein C
MQLDVVLALTGVFIATAVVCSQIVTVVLSRQSPERRRLEALSASPTATVTLERTPLTETPSAAARRFASLVPRSPKDLTRLRRRLMRAGYYSFTAAAVYTVAEVAAPLILAAVSLAMLGGRTGWIFALLAAAVGYMMPGMVLARQIEHRKKQIRNGLPDALDLLIVCLEAGCALDQAIVKASDELELAYPALAQELKLLIAETRAGKSRLDAFRNLADRTGVDDVRALVAMLIQTDRFGTSVAMALRTHAETSRTKRRQHAEERAAKVGVKLVFPLVFCLFPAFYVVILGPAVIQFVRVFFVQLGQQVR